MANLKICNLDLIAPTQNRVLVISGVEYEVKPLSVANFIELNLSRKKISEADDIGKGLKLMTTLIHEFIPTLPTELVNAMSIQQLQTVMSFIFDEIPDDVLENKPKTAEAEAKDSEGN